MDGVEIAAPLAAGFEDDLYIAPLAKRSEISIRRSAAEILRMWYQNGNPQLIIFFIFDS